METLTSLDLDEAVRIILERMRPLTAASTVGLTDALGRVLAAPAVAPMSLPPFPASAMDGYALRSSDARAPGAELTVIGASLAGHPFAGPVSAGTCVRIFTGAVLPTGADAVAMQENCHADADTMSLRNSVRPGENVRPAGHDIQAGASMMDEGRRLGAFEVGWLAAAGIGSVQVRARPRVGILSSGDELRDPGEALSAGAIYDANRTLVTALLRTLPVDVLDFGIVPDQRDPIANTLQKADHDCDVVISSGGVSVGDADWVRAVVGELGALELWRLNLKPGKPLAFGRLRHATFFGLPGNPVSAVITLLLVVRPALERLCGMAPSAPLMVSAHLDTPIEHQAGREEYQRASYTITDRGLSVSVSGDQSSNRLASFASANCLIRVPKDVGDLPAGSEVIILPFRGLL
jgi:molybdopterin molybdotransferase